jgi:SnoaL-like domain
MSKVESASRIVLKIKDAINDHDASKMSQFMNDNIRYECAEPPPDGKVYLGIESIIHYWKDYFQKKKNLKVRIEEMIGFGERCLVLWTFNWDADGGIHQHIRRADIFQERNGLIIQQYSYEKGEG